MEDPSVGLRAVPTAQIRNEGASTTADYAALFLAERQARILAEHRFEHLQREHETALAALRELRETHSATTAPYDDAVRQSRDLLQAIVDHAPSVIFVKDLNGRITFLSLHAAQLLRRPREEIIGRTTHEIFSQEDAAAIWAQEAQVIASGVPAEWEEAVHFPSGEHWFIAHRFPTRDAHGVINGVCVIATDITERRRVVEALTRSEERYRSLVATSTAIVWTVDAYGRFVLPQPDWERFTGQPAYRSQDRGWLQMVHPDDRAPVEAAWGRTAAEHSAFQCEGRLWHAPTSRYRYFAGRAVPVHNADGSVREWVGAFTDVEDARVAEAERRRHLAEIEGLNGRLKRSIAETHHRVKNNLQIVAALVDLQVDEGEATVSTEALRRIGLHTRALASIHDLLTGAATSSSPTDSLSASATLSRLAPLLQATAGGADISWRADNFALGVRESASLSLLVNETVSNALKHGGSKIEILLTAEGDRARLEVRDSGAGFPPDFDPETAAHTGLALIESAATHDLQGDVHFENIPGGGRVVVTFPLPHRVRTSASPAPVAGRSESAG